MVPVAPEFENECPKISATRELSPKLRKKNAKKFCARQQNGPSGPNATLNRANTVRNSASVIALARQVAMSSTPTVDAEI